MRRAFLPLLLSVAFVVSSITTTQAQQAPKFESQTVFNPQTDGMGYHNYRIPSLLCTHEGTLLAIMEGREDRNFDHAKNDLVLKRSTDNGKTWSAPRVIAEAGDNVVMNPVLVQAKNGTIILSYIYFPEKLHTNDRAHGVKQVDTGYKGDRVEKLYVIKSRDEGRTWSAPEEITKVAKSSKRNTIVSIGGPGVGITLTQGKYKGRVILPMSESLSVKGERQSFNFALYSDNNGKSWKHGKFMSAGAEGNTGGNEIQMVELDGGRVMASVRSKGHRLVSISEDGGKSWSPLHSHHELEDTGCMSSMLRYSWPADGQPGILMHVSVTGRVEGRRRGAARIAVSYDEGQTWTYQKELYNKTFDYSSLALLPDGSIGMLAEYDFNGQRADIRFAKFNLEWLESEKEKLKITHEVQRPEIYFRTHPEHEIPESMLIQKFSVKLDAHFPLGNEGYTFQYELLKGQGDARLLNPENLNKYATSSQNEFLADWYGENIVRVSAKNSAGEVVSTNTDTLFVHFSHTQMVGGDVTKLDKAYQGKTYITGVIQDGKLVYPGMRHTPSDISRGDLRYEGTKFGAYETKEPRIITLEDGTLVASYHYQVKGSNDAPPGLTLVMTRSVDGGKTWIDDQILMQDINGVVAYTSMVEYHGELQCYFAGGHTSHQDANTYHGVYRTVSTDGGKTWSEPELQKQMTELVSNHSTDIAPTQSPNTNALFIPDMEWKGQKGDAILVPFYVDPVHFVISVDGGKTWDVFYDSQDYPELKKALNEISWALTDDRQIYVVSRRQSKKGYKNEMFFDLDGTPHFLGQDRKNHKARRCHQGAVKVATGPYAGRVAVASNLSGDREEATVALSHSNKVEQFTTKYLTHQAAWGYCHIEWNPHTSGFVLIGESEPFDSNEQVVPMDGGPDRNERFSIECFAFSPEFWETLVEANIH